MAAADLCYSFEPQPAKAIRQCFKLVPRVMPFKRQYAHLPQLRICAGAENFPLRAFDGHLNEVETFDAREAECLIPADTFDLLGLVPGGGQRILD